LVSQYKWGVKMTNQDIADAWANNKSAKTSKFGSTYRFHTNGNILWSYSLMIGYTSTKGRKIVIDYTGKHSHSRTTSRHVGAAKNVADEVQSLDSAPTE